MILVFRIEQSYYIPGIKKEIYIIHYFFGVP